MRRAARVDGPHTAIVKALRRAGCQVLDLRSVGLGSPDLLVRAARDVLAGRWPAYVLMEVKTARGKLRPEQQAFIARWPETVVVRSVEDALRAIGAVKC